MSQLRPTLVLTLLLTLLAGVVYPALVTLVASVAMPWQASGSLIRARDGRVIGSELIGQPFDDPGYFWGRPSATSAAPYDGAASSGSNLGPTNPALEEAIRRRVAALREADPGPAREAREPGDVRARSASQAGGAPLGDDPPVPIDLVTASASGLDPHVTPAAARYQVRRVARARGLPEARVRRLVEEHVEARTVGVLGEPRVNVLRLNLALDRLGRRS